MINSSFDPGLWPLVYDYVALRNVPNHWNFPSLKAPHWRVYWHNTAGAGLQLPKRILPIRPDHLYVIPPNINVGAVHHGHCRQLYVHFQVRHPYTLRGPPIIVLPLTKQRQYFTRRIITSLKGKETARQQTVLLVHAFLETLIADLMDQHLFFCEVDKRLLDTLNYLEQHLDQPIDNRELAAFLRVHPQTMRRLFKKELGKSLQSYLRQMRVNKACWLLRFSSEPIKTIANKTGFCDPYHFTRVFTTLTSQTPARFRDYNKN